MKTVIDTNVLIAANGRATHATSDCAAAAARFLADTIRQHSVVDDSANAIFDEYKAYCNFAGQPGVGDRFFQWYIKNRYSMARVSRVDIGKPGSHHEHLPDELHSFDASDHKWIAAFLISGADTIVNATDSDWNEAEASLTACGVHVTELDPAGPPSHPGRRGA